MDRERRRELEEELHSSPLTEREIALGYHFCPDWDGMLIGPNTGIQLDVCSCDIAFKKTEEYRRIMFLGEFAILLSKYDAYLDVDSDESIDLWHLDQYREFHDNVTHDELVDLIEKEIESIDYLYLRPMVDKAMPFDSKGVDFPDCIDDDLKGEL